MSATYLGLPARTVVAAALAVGIVGTVIGLALPTPLDRFAPCGLVAEVEDGVTTYLPASCSTPDELADRLDTIRDARPSDRFAELNGADLDADGQAAYLAEVDAVAAVCGHIADQLAWERCADDARADHRAEVGR